MVSLKAPTLRLERDSTLARFAPAVIASAILVYVLATKQLSPVPRGISLAAVIISWAAATLMRRRDVRSHGSAVTAIASAIAAGQTLAGMVYGVAAGLLIIACLLSMRASRLPPPERALLDENVVMDEGRRTRSLIVIGVIASAVITAALMGLPPLARRIEARFEAMFGSGGEDATAFSTTMVLGSTRGMLQSDAIVMHIDGDRPEYLRGAVYDQYDGRHWRTTIVGRRRKAVSSGGSFDQSPTRITLARGAPNGDDMRWFLPSGACDFVTASGRLEIDGFGVARRARSSEDPPRLGYSSASSSAGCTGAAASIAPPTEEDLFVSKQLATVLGAYATEWTRGATTDRDKLAAIDHQLSRFEYSLAVKRDHKLDPIIDFVTLHRAGHCEMFASAMVLMARTQGIPARVVGGYHVSEVNPLTGRAVVRDRHAHAWVEAWVENGWREYDPTPGAEANRKKAGFLDNLGDVISSSIERAAIAINKLGTFGTVALLGAIALVLALIRWITQRVGTRRRRSKLLLSDFGPPLPCFDALTDALARAGHARDESEPVEAFARRLASSGASWATAVSNALLSYAGLRYSNVGSEEAIVRDVERAAKQVRSSLP